VAAPIPPMPIEDRLDLVEAAPEIEAILEAIQTWSEHAINGRANPVTVSRTVSLLAAKALTDIRAATQ